MNFVALVIHGLQAISVFNEVVTVRLLLAVCFLVGGCGLGLVLTLAAPWWAGIPVPARAVDVLGALQLTALCLAFGSFSLTLGFLANRNSLDFLPSRDYRLFVEALEEVPTAEARMVVDVFPAGKENWKRAS